MKKFLFLLLFSPFVYAQEAQIIRGPYLQRVTPTSGIVRWRTDVPSSSLVVYGEKLSDQKAKVNLPELVTEHSVILDHLRPNKKYYYLVVQLCFCPFNLYSQVCLHSRNKLPIQRLAHFLPHHILFQLFLSIFHHRNERQILRLV